MSRESKTYARCGWWHDVSPLRLLLMIAAALAGGIARADPASCDAIFRASVKSSSTRDWQATITASGFDFARYTPQIYGTGKKTCGFLRDEMIGGEAADVYVQRFDATLGVTTAQIWISAKSGLVLREEIDGDITGRGKGHLSMQFSRQ